MNTDEKTQKSVTGSSGIVADGNVGIGDVSGQVAIGSNIDQNYQLSNTDHADLVESLRRFNDNISQLQISDEDKTIVKGDIAAAIKEAEKEKPNIERVKSRFESAVDCIKSVGNIIETVSKWDWTKKIAGILAKAGLAVLL